MIQAGLENTPLWYTVIAEALTGILYVYCLERSNINGKKLLKAGVIFLVQCFYFGSGILGMVYETIGALAMFVPYALIFCYFWFVCELDVRKSIYFSIRAFVFAEFLAAFGWYAFLEWWAPQFERQGEIICLILVYGISAVILYKVERRCMEAADITISDASLTAVLILGICTYMAAGWKVVKYKADMFGAYGMALFGMRTLVNLSGLVMLEALHLQLCKSHAERERFALEAVLQNQKQQYQMTRECIDAINYKYHDLKHQIGLWSQTANNAYQQKYMLELQKKIELYGAEIHTGNGVLDTILSEKGILCQQKDIYMKSIVDGSILQMLELGDMCAIFGNALDNAIEYLEQVPEKEKRVLRLIVRQVHQFVIIQVENYCDSEYREGENLPDTTKKERLLHGYGLKSMKYTAEKYGGKMSVKTEDGWFKLKIILPIV
ncbi:MAG: ATP-binding protein [Eubacteriales bacterium]|nr:ATP-binding protein [Eubacteriales bacterium]